jgi:hypothetical protein
LGVTNKKVNAVFFGHASGGKQDAPQVERTEGTYFINFTNSLLGFFSIIALFIYTILGSITTSINRVGSAIRRSPSQSTILLIAIFLAMAAKVYAGAPISSSGTVLDKVSVKMYHGGSHTSRVGYEWCSDSGTNRFATNCFEDFITETIQYVETNVSVGGGNVVSPMKGTVLIESLDYGGVYACTDVLYMPDCAAKLMPVSTFTKKGCEVTYKRDSSVEMVDINNDPMFSGIQVEGMYYFRCQTVRPSPSIVPEVFFFFFTIKELYYQREWNTAQK